jgi:hypothetical protein
VEVHNLGDSPIAEGELSLWISAEPHNVETGRDEDNAEGGATISVQVPALTPEGATPFQLPMQVDPGHWHVTATVWAIAGGSTLATAEGDVLVQGQHARRVAYDEHATRDLGVSVTHLTRVDASLYQVHFVVTNRSDAPVPAGLPVIAGLSSEGSGMGTTQQYDLPTPIGAAASVETYLTLEGASTGTLTAKIVIDPTGPSTQESTLVVQAEDVQGAPHGLAGARA